MCFTLELSKYDYNTHFLSQIAYISHIHVILINDLKAIEDFHHIKMKNVLLCFK